MIDKRFGAVFLGLFLIGSSSGQAIAQATAPGANAIAPTAEAQSALATEYRLGSGDKVRVTVYNEDTLSGEYEIDGSGNLAMQLVGTIKAAGQTVPDITRAIEDRLKQGYLRNPSVAIEVLNYRPFYVLGEVKQPGDYPYVSGMTVLNAIALAGGYTYRGKKGRALVVRASDPDKKEQMVDQNTPVLPGDIIRIPERIF